MSVFDQYLILSDMDGTFLGENATLLQKNLDAILEFSRQGGLFSLATGRDDAVMQYIFPHAKDYLNAPAILGNGCYLMDYQSDTKKPLATLPKEQLLPILKDFENRFPEVTYRISFDLGYLCPQDRPYPFPETSPIRNICFRLPFDKFLSYPWYKVVFRGNRENIGAICDYFHHLSLDFADTTTSDATLFEILPKGTNKGSAVPYLRSLFPDRLIVGVGDYHNDLSLLNASDLAFCPANAVDEIKQISSFHLCHHRDGCIADLINHLKTSGTKTFRRK